MTEDDASLTGDIVPVEPAESMSAGTMLRQLRESSGVHLAVVASALKISPRVLEALEQDRLDQLPDMTFARGLAASICRSFGVDPEPVLAQMPGATPQKLDTPSDHLNQPFYRASDRPSPVVPRHMSRPLAFLVGILLLGALLIWLWPTLPVRLTDGVSESIAPSAVSESVAQAPQAADADGNIVVPADEPITTFILPDEVEPISDGIEETLPEEADAADDAPADADGESLSAESIDPTPESTVAGVLAGSDAALADAGDEVAEPEPARVEEPASPVPEADDLAFVASGDSWISVRDSAGQTLLNQLLHDGDRVGVNGQRPYSVTIGRKEEVRVTVRGESFDHLQFGGGSVARFKVD